MTPAPWETPAALAGEQPLGVLLVDEDPHYLDLLATALDREPRLQVATATPETALDRLDGVDCVVGDRSTETTALELLDAIRERDATLPFVLHAADPPADTLEALHEDAWTDYQPKGCGSESYRLLARRIRRLADYRRTTAGFSRAIAGLESAGTGVALVDPDGIVTYANRQYATTFGVDRESAVGDHWREHVPAEEADRLATDAVPTATDGWRWTGTCVGHRADGEPVETRISLLGLDDGSLVFVVDSASAEPVAIPDPEWVQRETEGLVDAGSETDSE